MSLVYQPLKVIIRTALKCYFNKIEVIGTENVPKKGPFIVSPNHQNAFVDALLVATFIPRQLHFLTRSDVFNRWSRPLMSLIHMMPIYRIRDGYSTLAKNTEVFSTCEELFQKDRSVLIFSEGGHGEHHYLRPLTKGSSRLALQAQVNLDKPLKIIPIGLNYFSHRYPRTKVIVVFGKPIVVSDHIELYRENPAQALIKLKESIALGMKATLLIPNNDESYEELKSTIFKKENERLSWEQLKELKPTDQKKSLRRRKHLLAKILNPLPFMLIHKVVRNTADVVFHTSIKFSMGLILFPIWWILAGVGFSSILGIFWGLAIVALMISVLFLSYK